MVALSRRDAVLAGIGGAAALAVAVVAVATDFGGTGRRSAAASAVFGPAAGSARSIGEAYREAAESDPVLSDPEGVPEVLVPPGTTDGLAWFEQADPEVLRRGLLDAAGADFASGRMPETAGWLLPVTLLQVCAMAAEDS